MIDKKHMSQNSLVRLAQGEADMAERVELLEHLTHCPECMERLTQYFDQTEEVKPPADFVTQTAQRIREETADEKPKIFWGETVGAERQIVQEETVDAKKTRIPTEINRKKKGRGELMRYSVKVSAAACAALILLFTQSWMLNGGWEAAGHTQWWSGSPGQILPEKSIEKMKASEWRLKSLTDNLFKWGGNEK